jgi:DNA-damage-inducible protein J
MSSKGGIHMAQVNIRIDDTLKEQGESLFSTLGMSFSTAVSIFVSQSVREGGLPFSVTIKSDPFFSDSNMSRLRASIADLDAGRGIVRKTMGDLEAMENG